MTRKLLFLCAVLAVLFLVASVYIDVEWKGYPFGRSLGYHAAVLLVVIGVSCFISYLTWKNKP